MDAVVESPFKLRPPFSVERPEGSGTFVRLHDDILACVVYLGWPEADKEDEIEAEGTGFLVQCGGAAGNYIVTAAHVAKALEDAPFGVRMNNKLGQAQVERVDSVKWWYHPTNDKIDVAVMQFNPPDWAIVSPWIPKWAITEFKRESKNIGAGDLAHIVGLYAPLPGKTKNTPIVHTGHIAMMSDDEPIPCRDWRAADPAKANPITMNGYLVEAQTLNGLSGSPVFVRRSLPARVKIPELDTNPLNVWWHGSLWLLGLWHGAWFGDPSEAVRKNVRGPLKVSAGMGVVVPATQILEALNQPELVAMRDAIRIKAELQRLPEPRSTRSGSRVGDALLKTLLNTAPAPRKAKAKKKTG